MIDHNEAAAVLQRAFPKQQKDTEATGKENIYQCMRRFLALTAASVREHNYKAAGRYFKLASELYESGSPVVRNTIENIFIYSFSSILHAARQDRRKLISILPATLYTLYLSQACHTGY